MSSEQEYRLPLPNGVILYSGRYFVLQQATHEPLQMVLQCFIDVQRKVCLQEALELSHSDRMWLYIYASLTAIWTL